MPRRFLGLALILTLLATATLACGRDDGIEESLIVGDSLTVYSSLPLHGPLASVSRDVVRAEKLALREAGGRAGAYDISYAALDSSDPKTGRWDPGRVASNARRAVQTPNTIAYLGELEAGASAISLPILNEGGILQVSPRDTFAGLTERGGRGEPEKYYPSGVRSFARVVPAGDAQARALVDRMADQGVERLIVADDRGLPGTGIGDRVASLAGAAGIAVVERLHLDPDRALPAGLTSAVRDQRPDAVLYGGGYDDVAVQLLRAVHAADSAIRLFGTDSLTLAPELPAQAAAAAARLELIGVDPGATDGFDQRFEAVYGKRPDRQAIFGYRAMKLVLDAVRVTGKDAASRRAVIRQAVERTTPPLARFARYRVERDRLVRVGPPL